MSVQYKKILIGITGGIAAYKVATLIRLLIKQGAEVKVVMTASALDFITPLTLATLAKGPVYSDFYDRKTGVWHNHVELGLWADLMLIAPLTSLPDAPSWSLPPWTWTCTATLLSPITSTRLGDTVSLYWMRARASWQVACPDKEGCGNQKNYSKH